MTTTAREVALQGQLQLLLSANPRTPLADAPLASLQPRALDMPLAQRQELVLAATAGLCGPGGSSHTSSLLLQLLQALAGPCEQADTNFANDAVREAAGRALEQHRHLLPLQDRRAVGWGRQAQPAATPAWLAAAPASEHCFAWLQQQRTPPPAAAAAAQVAAPSTPQGAAGAQEQQEQQGERTDVDRLGEAAAADTPRRAAAAGASEPAADGGAAKRRKLDPAAAAGAGLEPEAEEAAGGSSAVSTQAAAAQLPLVLRQLEAFAAEGDGSCLDVPLLALLLTSAASPSTSGLDSNQQQALQEALRQLPCDALQVLLQGLLQPPAADTPDAGGCVDSQALAFVLHTALLPQLQGLAAAAPQALLACLVLLGRSSVAAPVAAQVLLAPLVVSAQLLPVQSQLLLKAAKEAEALQDSVLSLLLQAAVGSGSSTVSCCWREPHATLLKGLIDSCPAVVGQQLDRVLRALAAAVQQPALAKSAAVGQLLLALVKGCGGVLSAAQVQALQGVVAATSSFLSKALAAKVAALAAQQQQQQ